jgi:hypothetical protein
MIAAALAVVAALALAQDAPVAPAPAAPPAPDAPEPVRPKDAGASAQNTPMERETDEAWPTPWSAAWRGLPAPRTRTAASDAAA